MWSGIRFVNVEMGGFEAINGNSVVTTVDVDGEVFVGAFDDWVRSIVWRLEWFSDSIVPDEHVCSSGKTISDVAVALSKTG